MKIIIGMFLILLFANLVVAESACGVCDCSQYIQKKEPLLPKKNDLPAEQALKELNERQKEAVFHQKGPLLILAGAGSGKTKVIALRVANLIKNNIQPKQILAITFTNKAAGEMRERVFGLLCPKTSWGNFLGNQFPFISTFHSLGVFILRENHKILGINRNFSIFDEEDSLLSSAGASSASPLAEARGSDFSAMPFFPP